MIPPGPQVHASATTFVVWAPLHDEMTLRLLAPHEQALPMARDERGYHAVEVDGAGPGARYLFRLPDGRELPDPASRLQPGGVHGPSQVVAPSAPDTGFSGLPLEDYVVYELHVGTFTTDGTFDAATAHLDELAGLGITAVEIMPVAQFPGGRNWGYDGVFPYAVQDSYGGPEGLRRFVDACHARGMCVILDVVYNHLGPEGNYLAAFAPYFTDVYTTPWGRAVNFDGPDSDEVRRYFIGNALYWLDDCGIDALRLDAIHGIYDFSAKPFLAELAERVRALASRTGRHILLIAESDLNDARVLAPASRFGFELDGQWSDDFHHAVHALVTGERNGYYEDFGSVEHLATVIRRGWFHAGEYSRHRRRRHGNAPDDIEAHRLVVCVQNHDQVGNRMLGERLAALVDPERLKLAAGCLLTAPFTPMLFMGEEYAETRPFQYFVSHGDPELVKAVREGRTREFASFGWEGPVPDPQSQETFERSVLDRTAANDHIRNLYMELLALRREIPALRERGKRHLQVVVHGEGIVMYRHAAQSEAVVLLNFGDGAALPVAGSGWRPRIDSADRRFGGPGSLIADTIDDEDVAVQPASFAVLTREAG